MAMVMIITIFFSLFMPPVMPQKVHAAPLDAGGDPGDPLQPDERPEEKTQIKSVIPYATKTENGVPQTLPVESREDLANATSVFLNINVYINAEDAVKYYGSQIYIFKLKPYEETADIANGTPDGSFDLTSSEGFSYNYKLRSELANLRNGEIFNKFAAAVKIGDKFEAITDAKYINNINSLSNKKEVPPASKTKKGLAVQMLGEARMLGVGYTAVNMFLNDFMSAEEGANTEVYVYQNENYYFNIDKISEYDKKIKYLTNEGINVTAVLLISARGFTPSGQNSRDGADNYGYDAYQSLVPVDPIEYMIHPNAFLYGQNGEPFFYGVNSTNEMGVKYFEALMSFIADRYIKPDAGYGRVYNIILGSEIGRTTLLNNCGRIDIAQYVKDYMRALRICDTAIRSRFGGSRVYIPFDNWFAEKPSGDGNFVNKEIIDRLCEYSIKEGNFIWNVAYHAYNADPLNPECWKETAPTNDYSTPIITMKNIKVLCDYMNLEKKDYLPNEELRKVMLADQGFSSGDNSKENQELQAAAFVYAYLKVKYIPDITAFIYHGHVDSANDFAASFGLWTNMPDTVNEPFEKKKIYDVFKYMDTNRETEKIEFAKAVLGIEDFTEIVPRYAKESEPAVILTEVTGETVKSKLTKTFVGRFNEAKLSGFMGSSNISDMSKVRYQFDDPKKDPADALFAGFTTPVKGDFGGIFKISTPDNPIPDLTGEKYIGANLRIDTLIDMPEDQKIQMILIIESGPAAQISGDAGATAAGAFQNPGNAAKTISVFEGIANISPNKNETFYFDISSWDGDKANIKKIKLLVNPYAGSSSYLSYLNTGSAGQIIYPPSETGDPENSENSETVDTMGKYDFNLYVFSIVSARHSRMSGIQTFFAVIFLIIFLLVAAYAVLYVRARIIKKKRRELRELQQKQKRARAAAQAVAQARGQQFLGSGHPGENVPPQYRIPSNRPDPNQNRLPPGNHTRRGGNRNGDNNGNNNNINNNRKR